MSAKNISVGFLARHGFDLRNKLGSVLKPKFGFTSVSGILKAYQAAFGKISDIEDVLNDSKLSDLETTRNLIVHRPGLVDDEFKNRTGTTLKIGDPLIVSREQLKSLPDKAIEAGSVIFESVEGYLSSKTGKEKAD